MKCCNSVFHPLLHNFPLMFLFRAFNPQTITITGVTGGTFKLWVQDMYPTTDLTLASTTSEIANALTAAANMLTLNDIDVECNSFSVSKALFQSNTAIQLNITFVVNNEMPLSHTTAYVDDLTGKSLQLGAREFFLCRSSWLVRVGMLGGSV
jgi:hypothetical protein